MSETPARDAIIGFALAAFRDAPNPAVADYANKLADAFEAEVRASGTPQPDPTIDRRDRYAQAIHDAMEPDLSLVDQEPGSQALFARAGEAAAVLADDEQAAALNRAVVAILTDAGLREAEGEQALAAYGRELARLVQPDGLPAPVDWIEGHPQLEAIAAAVWEKCGRSDSGACVEDDPRNIAVAALAALPAPVVPPAPTSRAADRQQIIEALYEARRPGLGGMSEAEAVAYMADAVLRRLAAVPAAEEQPDNETPDETDEQRTDREETERAHAAGDHEYCGPTCEVQMASDKLRNFILAKSYPGAAGMLDELLRRAAAPPAVVPQPEEATAEERRCPSNDIGYGLCIRPALHDGECFHEVQPIRIDEETDEDSLCGAEYPGDDNFVGQLCGLPKEHFGQHRCEEGFAGTAYTAMLRWPNGAAS